MARAEAKRGPSVQAAIVARGLRESALWIFGALALILFVALASYDRSDPAFSSTGQDGPVTNLIGPFGAWLSDLFFVLFGAPAFLFPVMLGLAGWVFYRERTSREPIDRRALGMRGVGFALALATSCGLATLHFSGASFPNTAGGVLGALLGDGLDAALGFLGATLLLLAVWLGSVALFTGISWLEIMDRVGQGVLAAISWVRERASTARDVKAGREVKQARQEVVREEQKKAAERKPPKIEAPAPKVEKSERVEKEKQVPMFERPGSTALPALSLLDDPPRRVGGYSAEALEAMSRLVELKLRDFGVEAEVVEVHPGPVITRFELRPAPGVKVAQISNLAK
ncbi:MAG: segregation ATPase FtsK/SpoIIIE, family, partial [Pseudomonadota bacterium]|nr:segregation ATPase FtsK/SpoIIIE, family [Pseudomonadota bacterium]